MATLDPGQYVSKSATKRQNLQPVWNERHDIDANNMNDALQITVFDYDVVGSNDVSERAVWLFVALVLPRGHTGNVSKCRVSGAQHSKFNQTSTAPSTFH